MKKNDVNLSGNNLYLDSFGDLVYYNILDKNGYIVSKEMESKFKLFYYRYSVIFIILILFADYFKTMQNTLLAGAAAVVISELYFRVFFLKGLKVIKEFKRERKVSKLESIISSKEKEKAVIRAGAYVLLSVLLVLNAIQKNSNVLFLALSILGAMYSLYIGGINIIAFSKMKRK